MKVLLVRIGLVLLALIAVLPATVHAAEPGERCVKVWRPVYWAAQAGDTATTLAATSGKDAEEANPLIRAVLGKKPKPLELVAYKAAQAGLVEVFTRGMIREGNYKGACRAYQVSTFVTATAVGLNLRFIF